MTQPFTIHEAGHGVWAAVSPPMAMPAISNAAIVDLGDRTVIVDSFMTPEAAEALVDSATELTGRRPDLLITTHHHDDHVGGNAVFATVPRVGTSRMRELITDEVPLPDFLISGAIEIAGSSRRISVIPTGLGHTESDVMVHIPDVGTAVAGDLVWDQIHPKTSDGFPADWVGSLEIMEALEPTQVIPGHGEVGGAGLIGNMISYMAAIDDLVYQVSSHKVTPVLAEPPTGFEAWQGAERFRAGLEAITSRS